MNRIKLFAYCLLQFSILASACLLANTFTLFSQVIESTFQHPTYQDPDIFVITNRQTDTRGEKFEFINHVKPDPALTFFRVNASSTDSLLLTRLDSIAFLREISEIEKQDWLLFIHGDSKTFEEAVIRGLNIQNTHHVRVIVFAWPSKDLKIHGLDNFYTSYENVEKSLDHFHAVLRTMEVLRNSPTNFLHENHLSLFLHSLGNYFLDQMGSKNRLFETNPLLFDNVIINAAAVEQKNHAKWVEQLQFQENIFINSNHKDFNLRGLRFFTQHGLQLGQKAKAPFAKNALYFNFSRIVGCRIPTGQTHTYFFGKITEGNKNICLTYSEMFHGQKPDLADENRFKKNRKLSNNLIVR